MLAYPQAGRRRLSTRSDILEQPFQVPKRSHVYRRRVDNMHRSAQNGVEHPGRNLEAVALLVAGDLTPENKLFRVIPLPPDEHLPPGERVPLVHEPSALGFVGVVLPTCTTGHGRTSLSGRRRPS
jgi:hypothetical protein